jgi:hypothetical protein
VPNRTDWREKRLQAIRRPDLTRLRVVALQPDADAFDLDGGRRRGRFEALDEGGMGDQPGADERGGELEIFSR